MAFTVNHMHNLRIRRMFSISFLLFIAPLLSIITHTNAIELDIHLKLESDTCLYKLAVDANQELHHYSSSEQMSFRRTLPHISLYLTNFEDESIAQLMDTLEQLDLVAPSVEMDGVTVNGDYSMYSVQNNHSLLSLSNAIVEKLHRFIYPHQPVPSWVYDLPEPSRSRKIEYVNKYGSPNIFDEFEPHMTVGYDVNDDNEEQRRNILWNVLSNDDDDNNDAMACKPESIGAIGIGVVGDWGTVVYDLAVIHLNPSTKYEDEHRPQHIITQNAKHQSYSR